MLDPVYCLLGMSSRGCRSRWNIGATAGTVLEGGGDLPVIGEYWLNGVMDEEFKTVAETVERTFREALGNGKGRLESAGMLNLYIKKKKERV